MNTKNCLPEKFVEKLQSIIPDEAVRLRVIESFSAQKKTTVRINTLKADVKAVAAEMDTQGILYEYVHDIPNAFIIENRTSRELTETTLYKEGKIYIQSLSSMIPAYVLDPQKGEAILDMAAAPGSKTSQLAAMMENTGELIANDIDKNRLYRLRAVLQLMGVTNTKIVSIPGQRVWEKYPEYFDKVLLDAPCSMEGRFDCNDPKSTVHWSQKKVKNLAKLQRWLLRSAVSATKVGGTVVYSTCTLSLEENEETVQWILEKERGNIELCSPHFDHPGMVPALASLGQAKRILPDDRMEAFFIAKFKKIHSSFGTS